MYFVDVKLMSDIAVQVTTVMDKGIISVEWSIACLGWPCPGPSRRGAGSTPLYPPCPREGT
jgi:hypothetical protein